METLQGRLEEAVRLHQANRLPEAEKAYRAILAESPTQPDALNLLGVLTAATNRAKEARRLLEAAAAQRPGDGNIHYNLAKLQAMQGDWPAAEASYRTSLSLLPQNPIARAGLGGVLSNLRRRQEAERCFRDAFESTPAHPAMLNDLGMVLQANNVQDLAEQAFRRALELQPKFAPALANLGGLLRAGGRFGDAESAYRAALDLGFDPAGMHLQLGDCCQRLGRFEEAIDHYGQAVQINERLFSQVLDKLTSAPKGKFSHHISALKQDLKGVLARS